MRMRQRGTRINLRPLADMRNLAWLPVLWLLLYYVYRGVTLLLWALLAVPKADVAFVGSVGGAGGQQGARHGWEAAGHHQ